MESTATSANAAASCVDGEMKVLSVQSHVVRDHVGNCAAVFPLQHLGVHVDWLNSVNFSSMFIHEGYTLDHVNARKLLLGLLTAFYKPKGSHHPGRFPPDISMLLPSKSLEDASLSTVAKYVRCDYSHILTGYIGSPLFLEELASFIEGLKSPVPCDLSEEIPSTRKIPFFVCDPVLGDNDALYVSDTLVEGYVNKLIPLADMITPNQYEAQWISGVTLRSFDDVSRCLTALHQKGPKMVVITSVKFSFDENLYLFASKAGSQKISVSFKQKPAYLGGTGDLIASLLTFFISTLQFEEAVLRSLEIVQDVIDYTLALPKDGVALDIIGAQKFILNPCTKLEYKIFE